LACPERAGLKSKSARILEDFYAESGVEIRRGLEGRSSFPDLAGPDLAGLWPCRKQQRASVIRRPLPWWGHNLWRGAGDVLG
jgi:hypothetical protein